MITDEFGTVYQEIEGFTYETKNDFTVEELTAALGEDTQISFVYPINPDADERGYSLTMTNRQKYPDRDWKQNDAYSNEKAYVGRRLSAEDSEPIGYQVHEVEDFSYEGGAIQGIGTFKAGTGGNLGDGHEAWQIFTHVESGRVFRLGGYYSSWDGGEMDDWVEVEPVQVTVLRYKPKGKPDSEIFENPTI